MAQGLASGNRRFVCILIRQKYIPLKMHTWFFVFSRTNTGCLLANLLALFLSFLAAWQSSSNQGLVFLFGNGEVLGILAAAISSNVLENMAILSSASLNKSGVISEIYWSWKASHFAFLKFHYRTLSSAGWSYVFAMIIMWWWSLPNLFDETSHATSMYIEGWHKKKIKQAASLMIRIKPSMNRVIQQYEIVVVY